MISVIDKNIYDMSLISKIKEQTGPKNLKKIRKQLRNLAEDEAKEFFQLKITKLEEKKREEEKKFELKNNDQNIEIQHYIEDFTKSSSKTIFDIDEDCKGETSPSTFYDNDEKIKQINNSDFSANE